MRTLIGLLLSSSLAMVCMGMATPAVAMRLEASGLGGGALGLVLALHHLGFAAVAVLGGSLADRLGARRAIVLSGLLLAGAVALQALSPSSLVVGVARGGGGAAIALLCLAVEPGIGRIAGSRRGLYLGIYLIITSLSLGLGAPFAAYGHVALLAAAAIAVLILAAGLVIPIEPAPPNRTPEPGRSPLSRAISPRLASASRWLERRRIGEPRAEGERRSVDLGALLSRAPGATLAALAGGAATSAIVAVAPLQASGLGFGPEETSLHLMALLFAGAISPLPLGLIADRSDRDRVILVAATLATVSSLVAALSPPPFSIIFQILGAGFAFALYPLGVGLAQDRMGPSEFSRASGGLLLAFAAGSVLGPPVGGSLLDLVGPSALPIWVAGSASIAVLGPPARAWVGAVAPFIERARRLTRRPARVRP